MKEHTWPRPAELWRPAAATRRPSARDGSSPGRNSPARIGASGFYALETGICPPPRLFRHPAPSSPPVRLSPWAVLAAPAHSEDCPLLSVTWASLPVYRWGFCTLGVPLPGPSCVHPALADAIGPVQTLCVSSQCQSGSGGPNPSSSTRTSGTSDGYQLLQARMERPASDFKRKSRRSLGLTALDATLSTFIHSRVWVSTRLFYSSG